MSVLKGATVFLHGERSAGIHTSQIDVSDLDYDLAHLDEADRQEAVDDLRARLYHLGRFFDPVGGVSVLIVGWDVGDEDGDGDGDGDAGVDGDGSYGADAVAVVMEKNALLRATGAGAGSVSACCEMADMLSDTLLDE